MNFSGRFAMFSLKFLLLCTLLHISGALQSVKLSAAPPPKRHASEVKAGPTSKAPATKGVNLPLFFEANKGQTDPRVKFLTRSAGYTLFLTPTETVLAESKTQIARTGNWGGGKSEITTTAGSFVRMQLVGANPSPVMTGLEELPGKVNYLIGRDPSQWQTGVSLFSKVRTEQVYPGVDLLFHGDERQLEYDFIVAPGADPSKIAFRIRGAARIEIDADGDLVLHAQDSDFRMHKPVIYQAIAGERRLVEGGFVRRGKDRIAFQLGAYDHTQPLVIDPKIGFATFIGGNGFEEVFAVQVDDTVPASPKIYVAGSTSDSTTFGGTSPLPFNTIGPGPFSPQTQVEVGFLAKIDPTATGSASLVYLTFVSGKTPFVAADVSCITFFGWLSLDKSQGAGNVQPVVGGETTCKDYPFTVTLNPVTAPSNFDFGSVPTRFTSNGSAIDVAALLGANSAVEVPFTSVSAAGDILITGETTLPDPMTLNNLPVVNPYVGKMNNGVAGLTDCYLARLERSDMKITYATYLNIGQGSTNTSNVGCGAFLDAQGNILAGGNTNSGAVFNVGAGGANLANGFQTTFCPLGGTTCPGTTSAVIAMKLNPSNPSGSGQLVYGTYYSGGGDTLAHNGSFDLGNGVVAIVGATTSATTGPTSPAIPLANAYQSTNNGPSGGKTGFLEMLDTTKTGMGSLLCSTFLGGTEGDDEVHAVASDAGDPTSFRIILGGQTNSANFPMMNELQTFQGGTGAVDAFITVLKVPQPGQTPFNASLYLSTLVGSGTTSTAGGKAVDIERIEGLAVDVNHTIYATGNALSSSFFTPSGTTPNGFQTSCVSCTQTPPLPIIDDGVIFSIGIGGNATINSITVTPSSPTIGESQTQQFDAVGFFTDGTIGNVTKLVTWASSATNIATISNTTGSQGLATASSTNTGSTQITASITQNGVLLTSNAVTLTVAGAITISFDILGNNTSGGTVVDNQTPHLINCLTDPTGVQSGTCSAGYAPGSVITFTETPGPGAKFNGWSSQCATGSGGTTPTCVIDVPGGSLGAITAAYGNGTGTFSLTLALPASGDTGNGIVNTGETGGGINCKFVGSAPPVGNAGGACTNSIASGQIVQLIPTVSDPNSNFAGWAGTCPFQLTGTNDCFVTMSKAQTLTPVFTAIQVSVTVAVVGTGSVTSNTGGITCANPVVKTNVCTASFPAGSQVTLTATPGTGFSFTSFAGCTTTTGNSCSLTLNASNPSVTVTATFTINAYLLNVSTMGGSGTGTVTSNANNLGGTINCGPNNQPPSGCGLQEQFNWPITLTEAPTAGTPSSIFAGWAASGVAGFALPASCTTGTPTTCSFNMPVVPTGSTFLVTATFTSTPTGAALAISKSGPSTGTLNAQTHYTIVVTNNGPAAATGVTMNDPIPGPDNPPGFDAAVPGCFISNPIETTQFAIGCSFSSPLAAGASITIPYHVIYMSNGTFTNTATVNGTNNTNTTTNSASATTAVGTSGPTLLSITVTPSPVVSAVGTKVQFTATGAFSDGSMQNITATATWASSLTSVATISSAPAANPGQATVLAVGETVISAAQNGVSSDTTRTSAVLATPFTGQYQLGDLFVSDAFGLVDVFTPTGTFVGSLNTQDTLSAGMAFDKTGNLYVTTFDTGGVVKFDQTGKLLGRFGSGYSGFPESIVFSQSGNAIVGAAQNNATGPCPPPPASPPLAPIFEFDSAGTPVATFQAVTECRGTDWVELLKDQQTLMYTSEGKLIKSFNISTKTQNPDFASGLPGPSAFALRQLPDGDILVADSKAALLLNGADGAIKTTYTPTGSPTTIFALNLDPDGTSFWTADLSTGTVYKFDIASGNQLLSFVTPDGAASGLAVFGEKPPGQNNITIAGTGSGAGIVTSNPAGINCGLGGATGAICTAPFTDNTSVTLTATASTGSTFGSFSSNCAAPNPQTNPPTCTVALGTIDVPVTVTFNKAANVPALGIAKTHTGSFTQGQQGAQYTVTVSNATGVGSTSGTVTVNESVPSGLTLVSMAGTGWTCGTPNPANVCTRADALPGGSSYPSITVTVNVAAGATSPQVNSVTISGGGSASAMATDSTTIIAVTPVSIAVTPANQTILTAQTLQYTATGTFSDNSTKDITTQVTWASSVPAVATISNTAGSQGLATAATTLPAAAKSRAFETPAQAPTQQANTTISATLGEIQGSTQLTVTSSPVIITVAPPPPGQPAVPTINPGGAATYGLVLTSQPGFSGTITLSCTATTSSGAQASQFITCAPDPASVTIKPGGTTQVAIVLNTFCSRNVPLDMPVPGGPAGILIVVLTGLALASVTWMYKRRPRWVLTFAALVIATYSVVGCGSTPAGPAGRTPAGTYNLALTFNVNGGPAIPGPVLQLIIK